MSHRALNQTLTVPLALFGQIDDVLGECLASGCGITVYLEAGFIGLNDQPCVVERIS
jgi:hypothetical protein